MIDKVPYIQGFKVYVSYKNYSIHRVFTVKQRKFRKDISRYFLYEYESDKRNNEFSNYGGSLYFTGQGFVFGFRGNYFSIPMDSIDSRFGIIEQVQPIDFTEYRIGVQKYKILKKNKKIVYKEDKISDK